MGTSPSYAWWGIWEARSLLMEGWLWRIEDGKIEKLWSEPWIPGIKTLSILSHLLEEEVENLTVSSLLVAETNGWNEQLVRSTFNPYIAVEILKINLSPTPRPDQWIWGCDRSGKFSVKSACRTTQSIKHKAQDESSNPTPHKEVWTALRKMKVPHKVKFFAWRACHDALPTFSNLKRKKVSLENKCTFCNRLDEDLTHALFQFEALWFLWKIFVPSFSNITEGLIFPDVVARILHFGLENELAKLMCIVWNLWRRRNLKVYEGRYTEPLDAFEAAMSMWRNSQKTNVPNVPVQQKISKWNHPPCGSVNLKVDEALFFDLQRARIGFICRDHGGKVILATSIMERNVGKQETIGALAVLRSS